MALNLVIKPHLDHLINLELAGTLAATNGDPILRGIHFSLDEDSRWHREWADGLAQVAIGDTPANAEIIEGWIDRWRPRTMAAVEALAEATGLAPAPLDPGDVVRRTAAVDKILKSLVAMSSATNTRRHGKVALWPPAATIPPSGICCRRCAPCWR